MSIYKSCGKTAKEAFEGIWELMKYTDDYCLREENGEWVMRLKVVKPTKKVREDFEQKKLNI